MSVSFVGQTAAVKIRALEGDGFIQTDGGDDDWVFDLYAVDGDRALVLNEHELVWVELNRVYVLLNEPPADPEVLPDPSEPEA